MKLELELTPLKGFPVLHGAQQLAWNYLLDRVFAEAYHDGVGTLHLVLPSDKLVAEAELRANLTPAKGNKTARAFLSASIERMTLQQAHSSNMYLLHYGRLSPFRNDTPISGMEHLLSVFTWQARALGLPIRALGRSPHLADRAMFAMRQMFTSERFVPAYYHLYKTLTIDSGQSSHKGLA